MNLFSSYTYSWWQIGIFKLAMFTIGLAVGTYTHEWVLETMAVVVMVAVITSLYIAIVSFKQLY